MVAGRLSGELWGRNGASSEAALANASGYDGKGLVFGPWERASLAYASGYDEGRDICLITALAIADEVACFTQRHFAMGNLHVGFDHHLDQPLE